MYLQASISGGRTAENIYLYGNSYRASYLLVERGWIGYCKTVLPIANYSIRLLTEVSAHACWNVNDPDSYTLVTF